jgi:hypothetical protein
LTDIARDIGGLANVLLIFFSQLIYPLAHFSFILKAIKKFYYAKTKDKTLFKSK